MTERQKRFCAEYVACGNGTKAALAAGYATSGARQEASRLLKAPEILQEIERLRAPYLEKLDVGSERLIQELAKIAFQDPRLFFDKDGNPRPIGDLDPITAASIAGITHRQIVSDGQARGTVTKYILADKLSALEKLMRMHGMFKTEEGALNIMLTSLDSLREKANADDD